MKILLMDRNDSKWVKKFKSFKPIFTSVGSIARLYGNGNQKRGTPRHPDESWIVKAGTSVLRVGTDKIGIKSYSETLPARTSTRVRQLFSSKTALGKTRATVVFVFSCFFCGFDESLLVIFLNQAFFPQIGLVSMRKAQRE